MIARRLRTGSLIWIAIRGTSRLLLLDGGRRCRDEKEGKQWVCTVYFMVYTARRAPVGRCWHCILLTSAADLYAEEDQNFTCRLKLHR
jgi:hypothetical protein